MENNRNISRVLGALVESSSSGVKHLEWHILRFSSLLRNGIYFYQSSNFSFANSSWHLQLYAGTMLNGCLSLFLNNNSKHPCRVNCTFSIKDSDGELVGEKILKDIVLAEKDGFPNFFSLSILEECGEVLTPLNTLRIVCDLKLSQLAPVSGIIGQLLQSNRMNQNCIEWHISHFPSLFRSGRLFFYSPSFSVGNATWHLQLHPGTILSGYLSLFLCNESQCSRQVTVSLSIKDAIGRFASKEANGITLKDSWGVQDFISMDCVNHYPSRSKPAVVTLKLSTDDAESGISLENATEGPSEQVTFTETETLSKNLRYLLDSEDGWDTIIKVQEEEFKVHRAILIARSPVFAAMFQHDTKEKQSGVITITDYDPNAYKKLIEFLYCGKLGDLSFNNAFHLYSISDKYNLRQVTKFCSNYLRQKLSIENFCDVATLADRHDDTRLLTACQTFFNKNLAEILVTEDWKPFLQNNLDLANKMLVEMTKCK